MNRISKLFGVQKSNRVLKVRSSRSVSVDIMYSTCLKQVTGESESFQMANFIPAELDLFFCGLQSSCEIVVFASSHFGCFSFVSFSTLYLVRLDHFSLKHYPSL